MTSHNIVSRRVPFSDGSLPIAKQEECECGGWNENQTNDQTHTEHVVQAVTEDIIADIEAMYERTLEAAENGTEADQMYLLGIMHTLEEVERV